MIILLDYITKPAVNCEHNQTPHFSVGLCEQGRFWDAKDEPVSTLKYIVLGSSFSIKI